VIVHSTYFDLLKSPCGSAKMKSSLFYLEMTYYAHAVAAHKNLRQISGVPHYVYTYGAAWFFKILESMLIIIIAPMVYLDQNELYLPSDLQAHLDNTYPAFNYAVINDGPSSFDLSNLDQLNTVGNCSVTDFDACSIYLTSKGNVTANPQWLYGVLPDPETHETQGVKSCAVIVNDRGSGIVDAFYMYFYAFNLGNTVYGQNLGNHVGDWEQSGQAFTYEAVSKIGTRPIIYSAIGTHANYAVPGTHSRFVASATVNDTTSAGLLWDPILSAYSYTLIQATATNSTFFGSESSTPASWLSFLGRWGDEQYLDSDPRQFDFLNLNVTWRYESGPTGPQDKSLNRTEVCPDDAKACTTLSMLPAVSGSNILSTVIRLSPMTTTSSITAEVASSAIHSSIATATSGSSSTNVARMLKAGVDRAGILIVVALVL